MKKYELSFTLKNKPGYHCEYFQTKALANSWLKENKKYLYWFKLNEANPKSLRPKPQILFEPLANFFAKKTGTLQTHFETGMECLGLVFYKDGIHSGPNPNFDPSKPESSVNFQFFASWDAITSIATGQIIEFPDGQRIGMARDREFAKKDGYRISFYPQGYSKSEWLSLFATERVKVTIWIPIDKFAKDIKDFIRGPF